MTKPVSIAEHRVPSAVVAPDRLLAEVGLEDRVGADEDEQHEDDRVEGRLGDVQPDERPADRADVGHGRHRQRGAQVGPHAPVVGDRARRRAEDRAELVRRQQLRRRGARQTDEQRRQLDEPAAADDGVDPTRDGAGGRPRKRRVVSVGSLIAVRPFQSSTSHADDVEQVVRHGVRSASTRPAGRPGCRCAARGWRACRPGGDRGRPRRSGHRRRRTRSGEPAKGVGRRQGRSRPAASRRRLAGVDVDVEQVQHAVALEDASRW